MEIVKAVEVPKPLCELAGSVLYAFEWFCFICLNHTLLPPSLCTSSNRWLTKKQSNAIEFNSIPCIQDLVPGGRANMKIKIRLGVPEEAGKVEYF
jgi:hypothetical protein